MFRCDDIGINGLANITVRTLTCSQCAGSGNPLGYQEGGLMVSLTGDYGTSCQSRGLDNLEKVDYDNGMTTFFDGAAGAHLLLRCSAGAHLLPRCR